MGSSLLSNSIPYIVHEWNVTSQEQATLPISVYLIGYVFGPIICELPFTHLYLTLPCFPLLVVGGPLSEHIGRRNITITTFALFLI